MKLLDVATLAEARKKLHEDMITFEEIIYAVEAAAELGIKKIRVTGGEPLVRRGIVDLCRGISSVDGIDELCMNEASAGTLKGSIDTDTVATGVSTKPTGRYGNPMVTANDYQLYVKGLSAYVYKHVMAKYGKMKSCVVIDPLSQAKDSEMTVNGTKYFRAFDNTTPTGKAKYARGAECVENVTTNLATENQNTDNCIVYKDSSNSDAKSYKITNDLVMKADVIILQGGQSAYGVCSKSQFISLMEKNGYTAKQLKSKIIIDSNPQCVYGLTWYEGSAESPLEIEWIAKTYGTKTISNDTLFSDIKDFYHTFYDYQLSSNQVEKIIKGDYAL